MSLFAVTNTLLHQAYAAKDDADLSPLRVRALLYLLHGWYLAIEGQALLPTPFVAGQFGPVLPELEESLKSYGSSPVDEYLKEYDEKSYSLVPLFVNEAAFPNFRQVLNQVWNVYRPLSTVQLLSILNQEGSPWEHTKQGAAIDNRLIRADFIARAKQSAQV